MLLEKCKSPVWSSSVICFICSCLDPVVLTAEMKSITNGVPASPPPSSRFLSSPADPVPLHQSSFDHSSQGSTEGTTQGPACILTYWLHIVLFNFLHWTKARLPNPKAYWAAQLSEANSWYQPPLEAADCLAHPLIEFPGLHWRWRPVAMETVFEWESGPSLSLSSFQKGRGWCRQRKPSSSNNDVFSPTFKPHSPEKSVLTSDGGHLDLSFYKMSR